MKRVVMISLALCLCAAPLAAADRILRADLTVPAPVSEVWKAWTTEAGIKSFFAPGSHVDLRVDGAYDIWFNPAGKPGQRGAEGMRILDVDPMKRFAFTWSAPPTIPTIRGKRTVVVVEFSPAGENATSLRFTHTGWGEGADWDQAYDYFDHAWGAIVLPYMLYRFEKGPIDWKASPEVQPVATTLKQSLAASDLSGH